MKDGDCQLSICLSVEVDFKSLEDVGTFVDNSCFNENENFVVGLSGSTSALGKWNPEKAVLCKQKSTDDYGIETWQCRFTTDIHKVFHYRYFVAEIKHNNDEYSDSEMIRILAWESRLRPRTFSIIDYINSDEKSQFTHVKFGVFDDGKFIQRGWLTTNSEIHVRLSGTACKFFTTGFLNNPHTKNHLFIACSKYVVQPSCQEDFEVETVAVDKTAFKADESAGQFNHSQTYDPCSSTPVLVSRPPLSTGTLSFAPRGHAQPVLLSTLEINRCRIHRGENNECWGTMYKPGDDVTFYVETNDVENTTVVIEFFLQEVKPLPKDALPPARTPLRFVGCARFGPFECTNGRKASQILNAKQLPIGDLRVHFLVIHPMTKAPPPSLAVTYQHHWKKRGTVEIGHRGMGISFLDHTEKNKKPATTKENTLDSFRTAVQHGADYVEMDVQLTKDNQVIVYHDYEAVIISKKKRGGRLSYLPIAIKDLNYEDLRELKVHHSSVLHEPHSHEKMEEDDLDPIELQSFPRLRSCFEEIDRDLGFLIEVKYPMEYKGVCLESDRLLNVPNVVKLAHLHNLVVLAWGEAVNYPEKRAELRALGVDGIIVDRLHESREKGTLSIFKRDRATPSPVCQENDNLRTSSEAPHLININSTYTRDQCPLRHLPPLVCARELNDKADLGTPAHAQLASTHVALVKECVMFEKLSHTNSTTTCTSMPPTSLATFQPDSSSSSDIETTLKPEDELSTNTEQGPDQQNSASQSEIKPLQNAQPDEGAPMLADAAVRTKTSSTQHAVALITLA
ncbi:hypothetical protein FGIG_08829 [Fasciola gigantica]|uniref:GP-PDE domain-containing protein n=1 Tax=Fasciola gigantica TaxID=46835 RepID=A0A504YU54_FASGI|nr:hypothetical protein FGIG_08829 [Fasciola gigantica]